MAEANWGALKNQHQKRGQNSAEAKSERDSGVNAKMRGKNGERWLNDFISCVKYKHGNSGCLGGFMIWV